MKNSPNPLIHLLEMLIEGRFASFLINLILIPMLILIVLLLPPISLADRLMSIGYTRIGSAGGSLSEQGMEVNFLPEGVIESFHARLDIIPRSDFLEGSAGNSLLTAAESIPPNLIMISPYYRIQTRGKPSDASLLVVPMPRDIENPSSLDLYAWSGEGWQWLPNRKITSQRIIESKLDFTPQSVVVMSTHPINPNVSSDVTLDSAVPDAVKDTLVEVNPQGLTIADNGQVSGSVDQLPPEIQNSTLTVIPTIKNWFEDGSVRSDLVDNMLVDDVSRERHLNAIVDMVQRNAYQGIDIDYRRVSPELRDEYTAFLAELRQALPANKLLSVRVDMARQVSAETWETGAYDWEKIGEVADIVKIPTSPNPANYVQGGQMEALLDWAVGQVNRYKIQLILSTLSTEEVNGVINNITYQQALAPLGNVTIIAENNIFNVGDEVNLTLGGLPATTGIQFDPASGTYWYAYLDQNDTKRTVYLENAASIARKLQFVAQYNLRGVAIQNLMSEDNDAQIWAVIRKFLNLVIPPVESQYSVVWQVTGDDGGVITEEMVDLSDPAFNFVLPDGGTTYQVAAAIAANQDIAAAVPKGSLAVLVATPTPTLTPTPLPTATPVPSPTPEPTATPVPVVVEVPPEEAPPAEAEAPAGPAPVAAAQGNLPFDYGIQADPRGNTAANIGLIRGMGFNWVKFQMAWKDVEPSPGGYSWGMWDEVIGQYSANGVKVLLSIPKSPDWARPPDDDRSVEGPPQDPNSYANFVGKVAERYRGKVQAIEVWNEQNLYYEAGGQGRINPAAYTELLKLSYNSIKAVNPDMIVVSGAMTPTGAPPPAAMDDVEYLRQMYANGAKGYFDAVGAHPSGFANPPDALFQGVDYDPARGYDDHRSFFFRNTMEEYRRVMVENGDGDKTIWPTEFGWPVWRFAGDARFIFAQENSLQQQAEFTVRAYQLGKEWGWVGTMFLWNLDYNVTAANSELANFGIVGAPAYDALANMPK
jgi:spore germination protein YaaH